ncbi:MAG: pro-sigmaK processing inhibitor BofA family protein [Aristaeellaceae bacterium]
MSATLWGCIGTLCAAALILYLFCIRYDPKKPHARWLRHGVVGLMMLLMWNALPLPHLGLNPISAITAGALGLPGLGLIAVMNLLP